MSQKEELIKELTNYNQTFSFGLNKVAITKLIDYLLLLEKWNQVHNLTAIKTAKEMLYRHILDSLMAIKFMRGPYILDFGTGAGLPGIPLSLALPDFHFVLIDSAHKKIDFINYIIAALDLKNVNTVHSRVENFHFQHCFATIVTRATTTLKETLTLTKHLYCPHGQLIALKGKTISDEISELQNNFPEYHVTITDVDVPNLEKARTIVKIELN